MPYVRNLKSLGVESESFGPVLIPKMEIPETIRLEVTRSEDWDFEKVLKCIHDELVTREHCKFVTKPTEPSNTVRHENIDGAIWHKLTTKTFGGKSFGGKTSAEKLSDSFSNFGGNIFGQGLLYYIFIDCSFKD